MKKGLGIGLGVLAAAAAAVSSYYAFVLKKNPLDDILGEEKQSPEPDIEKLQYSEPLAVQHPNCEVQLSNDTPSGRCLIRDDEDEGSGSSESDTDNH